MDTAGRSPWAIAATAWAWFVAIALTLWIVPATFLIVAPVAAVATIPLVVTARHRRITEVVVASVLVVWSVLGVTLLGSYFLPSALLLAVAVTRSHPAGEA